METDILVHNAIRANNASSAQQPFTFDKRALDARGSLSVSEKTTLGNYVQDRNNLPFLIDRIGTSALANQLYGAGVTVMSVPANSGDYEIAQTFSHHPYYAGKSQVIEVTFDKYENEAGVVKRAGYFSSNIVAPYNSDLDGFWFESDGTDYKFAIGNANTGLIKYITQANWNIDKLDGTGTSGVTQDFSNFQVLIIDFLYLGGTAVRFGFKNGEEFHWAHAENHANIEPSTIIASPHQPIRWEIRSTGGAGSMEQICAGVHSEGSREITGLPASTPTVISHVNANTPGISYALAGIRLKNTASGRKVNILDTTISAPTISGNDFATISLILNPTIAGAPTWNTLVADSDVEYLVVDTNNPSLQTVTGGRILYSNFVASRFPESVTDILSLVRRLGHKIDGTADELILVITPLLSGTNADAHGIINFNIYINMILLTAELTNNGKAVHVKPNDLGNFVDFDWEEAYVPLVDIGRIELQTNNQGVAVYLISGASYLFNLSMVSMINGKLTNTNNPGGEIDTEAKLIEELAIMLGYKTA